MPIPRWRETLARRLEDESLRPDLGRATRATLAFAVPLILVPLFGLPLEAAFAAMAAQNIAMVDVRGAYRFRFALLVAMILVLAGATALGGLAAGRLGFAIAATVFLALSGGLWRHVSADYGPTMSIASSLFFFIALAAPPGHAFTHLASTLAGGVFGMGLQMVFWPVRPQHPLRRTVGETWLAVAALCERMGSELERGVVAEPQVAEAEAALRAAINAGDRTLSESGARPAVTAPLAELNLAAARLGVRVGALRTALESAGAEATRRRLAATMGALFDELGQLARGVALAVVSRQPAHVAACEVRLRRLEGLLRAAECRARGEAGAAQLPELLAAVGAMSVPLGEALRAVVARSGERAAFPMELLELETWRLRALASAIDLSPRVDPSLVRFTLRLAVLCSVAVAAFMLLGIPHGYWLPFTIVVVLQPDYGSTRTKAVERVLGTVAGGVVASALLFLHLGEVARHGLIYAAVFLFCHQVRRNYALAMSGVTIFVVLLLEPAGGASVELAVERVLATLGGGLLALGAALLFWPAWEKDRLPPLLASALRANGDYLRTLAGRLERGEGVDDEAVRAKRAAESANAAAFASLRRVFGDPKSRRERVERLAALANGNQRITRVANVLLLQLRAGEPAGAAAVAAAEPVAAALEALAETLEKEGASRLAACALALDTLAAPEPEGRAGRIARNHARAAAEARAMLAET